MTQLDGIAGRSAAYWYDRAIECGQVIDDELRLELLRVIAAHVALPRVSPELRSALMGARFAVLSGSLGLFVERLDALDRLDLAELDVLLDRAVLLADVKRSSPAAALLLALMRTELLGRPRSRSL